MIQPEIHSDPNLEVLQDPSPSQAKSTSIEPLNPLSTLHVKRPYKSNLFPSQMTSSIVFIESPYLQGSLPRSDFALCAGAVPPAGELAEVPKIGFENEWNEQMYNL